MSLIKNKRIEKGISQIDLSVKLGVSQSAVAKWETEQTVPRLPMLKKIAEALGCKIIDLLEEEE